MAEADTNRETELKLAARPQDLDALFAAPAIAGRSAGPAATRTLESTYYDTEDRRLAGRKVTLRVRKTGEGFVQTVKAAPETDGLGRGEWECAVTSAAPDLTLISDAEALDLLGSLSESELRPVFTSLVERTTQDVSFGEGDEAARIEVAFDRGRIILPDGAARDLCEVELELKEGPPAALYDLARELTQVAPLRLEVRTKAERGHALASGATDKALKAEKLLLDPETTVEGAVARIVRACLAHLVANEAVTLAGDDPEGVHQMRVALRRLRSATALFRPFIPTTQYLWLVGEIKWLAGSLGPARDWDVFGEELLAPVREAFQRADGHGRSAVEDLETLAAAAEARRLRAYEGVREAIRSDRYTAFLLGVGSWVEKRGWRDQPVSEESVRLFQPVIGLADHLLNKRHKKAKRAGHGFAHLPVAQRHQLRIALKKLRYAVEFFRSLYDDKPVRRYIQQLAAFQDALGHLNDVATATRLLHELHEDGSRSAPGEPRAAGIVIGWHARGVADTEAALVALWHEFLDTKQFWSKPDAAV
ncbi:CYTH and CHAD domain-containing protein [Azospirillum picis]|uniref:Inorganic triphosphatase YgiF n=1 Tax=Azospirillum picis TaxID=488438 RepID=A0ABU0MPD6_9PROT|nr:CYTH and CHAD domain-containing protein [Azospirillum picis]MBP2301490.1 inorganic triphosphatase YgiF [Azospirillum picis]MDQ0535322.1 inorganic triphosphatase YgiF [Azospirillum picis]